jgi:hypothetical protein
MADALIAGASSLKGGLRARSAKACRENLDRDLAIDSSVPRGRLHRSRPRQAAP